MYENGIIVGVVHHFEERLGDGKERRYSRLQWTIMRSDANVSGLILFAKACFPGIGRRFVVADRT
jgi:hypothetical protein